MATNLFAMPSGGTGGVKPLVEFKAGKMSFGANSKVTPDKRKGLLQLLQTPDSLLHFIWKDRTTGTTEDDLIIFPEEAVFKKVKQVQGRVFVLEFKASSRKLFFWMQEAKDDKDDENLTKINQYINNPPSPDQGGMGMGGLPSGLDQSSLMSMFAPPPSSSSPSSSSSSSSSGGSAARAINPNVGLGDLQSILSGMGIPTSAVTGLMNAQRQRGQQQAPASTPSSTTSSQPATTQPQAQPAQQEQPRGPSLSQVLNPELLMPLLANPTIQNQLLPFLPEERRTPEEIREVIRSPQFQQSLDHFTQALATGQLTEMLRQFGIDTSRGAPTTVEQLLQAIQNSSRTQQPGSSSSSSGSGNQGQGQGGDKKDDNSGMDTS